MYTLLFCATVIALASAATVTTTGANPNVKAFPEKGLRTQNFATIRFLNQLSTVSNGVFQADDDDFTSLNQIEAFVVVSGETDQEVNFSGGGDGITNYETITLAEDPVSSFTIVLRNTPADAMDTAATLATCPSITVDGLRKTIVLTQTETPVNEFDTCTTTSGSSACTRQVGTEVSFQCQVFSESLTPARTCDTLPADFIQFHESTCPLRLVRTDAIASVSADETVSRIIDAPTETLAYASGYELEGTSATYPEDDNDVRRYSTIVTGSLEADVETLKTGYLNVLNAAYIEEDDDDANTVTRKLNSVFVVVCNDGSCNQVVASKNVQRGSFFDWLELRAAQYSVEVYGNGVTLNNFRDTGVSPLVQTQVNLGAAKFAVLAVRTASGNVVNNARTLEVDVTPPTTGTTGIAVTRVTNLIDQNEFDTTFVLAKPDGDCCNRLADTFAPATSVDVSSADLVGTSYNAYLPFTNCGSQGAVIGTVTFPTVPSTGCAFNAIFVLGQTVEKQVQTCSSVSAPNCGNTVAQQSTVDLIVPLSFARDNTGNNGASAGSFSPQPTTLQLPVCQCVTTSEACDVCDLDEFEALNSNVAAIAQSVASSVSSLRSAQTSNTNAINAAIAASSNNVIAVLGNNIEDVEELVEDVEELVEDVEDEAGDAVDAAEDADKAAKKATSQAKAAKNLVKEVLAILPTPPPVFVP